MAKKYRVSFTVLSRRATSEGWTADRLQAEHKAATKAIQATAVEKSTNAAKYERARGMAIERIIRALERMPENGGSHSRQTITDGGKRLTVDHDLLSLVSALEKLSAHQGMETQDDPLAALLGRLDDEVAE